MSETTIGCTERIQWNGRGWPEGPPAWLLAAAQARSTPDKEIGAVMRLRDELHVGTRFGVMIAQPRDWLVRTADGEIGVLSDYERELNVSFEDAQP